MSSVQTSQTVIEPLYGISGIDQESQAQFYLLGEAQITADQPVDHNRVATFQVFENVIGDVYVCKFRRETALKYRNRIPLLFLNIWLIQETSQYLMFQLFLYFKPQNSDFNDDQFLEEVLEGEFITEVVIENDSQPLDQKFKVFPGKQESVKRLINFVTSKPMKNFIREMVDQHKKKMKEKNQENFEDLMQVPEPTIKM